MPEPAIIVVGASAGGVEALLTLAGVLPAGPEVRGLVCAVPPLANTTEAATAAPIASASIRSLTACFSGRQAPLPWSH